MKSRTEQLPIETDQLGSRAAIRRAALRARELARQTNTPCYVLRNGRVIDVAHEIQKAGNNVNVEKTARE